MAATMWSAPAMLSNSACGTKPRNAVTLSSLTTRLMLPRTSKVGRRSLCIIAAISAVHRIITDRSIQPEHRDKLIAEGVEVVAV